MASFKFATLLIATLIWASVLVSSGQVHVDKGGRTPPGHSPVGKWKRIPNLSDPEIIAIAEFAVDEHNKAITNNEPLTFKTIKYGVYQIVAGINYRLLIEAQGAHEEKPGRYAAFVFVGLDKSRKLIYFDRRH